MAIGPNVVDDCEGMTEEDYWRGMDEAMQDEEGDEPFCTCSTGHGIEETDWNQCDSCGKPIYDEEPEWQNDVQAAFGGIVQTPQG